MHRKQYFLLFESYCYIIIHSYSQSVSELKEMMKELRESIDEREKVSIVICHFLCVWYSALQNGQGGIKICSSGHCLIFLMTALHEVYVIQFEKTVNLYSLKLLC